MTGDEVQSLHGFGCLHVYMACRQRPASEVPCRAASGGNWLTCQTITLLLHPGAAPAPKGDAPRPPDRRGPASGAAHQPASPPPGRPGRADAGTGAAIPPRHTPAPLGGPPAAPLALPRRSRAETRSGWGTMAGAGGRSSSVRRRRPRLAPSILF